MGGIAIAFAIVLAMGMYLLDKHGLLKRALIISLKAGGFALLVGLIGIGLMLGYHSWKTSHPAKQTTPQNPPDESAWQVVSESPAPSAAKIYTVSHAELARSKLFRRATEEGRISLLQSTDSFYAGLDKSAQRISGSALGGDQDRARV